jgi:hypothetical protein
MIGRFLCLERKIPPTIKIDPIVIKLIDLVHGSIIISKGRTFRQFRRGRSIVIILLFVLLILLLFLSAVVIGRVFGGGFHHGGQAGLVES